MVQLPPRSKLASAVAARCPVAAGGSSGAGSTLNRGAGRRSESASAALGELHVLTACVHFHSDHPSSFLALFLALVLAFFMALLSRACRRFCCAAGVLQAAKRAALQALQSRSKVL